MASSGTNPHECRCGYPASSEEDLAEHVTASMHVEDDQNHGAAN